MTSLRPVTSMLAALLRRAAARLVRLHASQLHPLAPSRMHRRLALALADLEGRS